MGGTRRPLRVWALTVVTLGVYGMIHHYTVNRELRDFGVDVRPVLSVLAIVPGAVLIAPPFVSAWRTGARIAVAQETVGNAPTARPGTSALLTVALLAVVGYHQRELNRVWAVESARPGARHR